MKLLVNYTPLRVVRKYSALKPPILCISTWVDYKQKSFNSKRLWSVRSTITFWWLYSHSCFVCQSMFYDISKNPGCNAGHECGHYKQLAWAETRQLGCAMAICRWVCEWYLWLVVAGRPTLHSLCEVSEDLGYLTLCGLVIAGSLSIHEPTTAKSKILHTGLWLWHINGKWCRCYVISLPTSVFAVK